MIPIWKSCHTISFVLTDHQILLGTIFLLPFLYLVCLSFFLVHTLVAKIVSKKKQQINKMINGFFRIIINFSLIKPPPPRKMFLFIAIKSQCFLKKYFHSEFVGHDLSIQFFLPLNKPEIPYHIHLFQWSCFIFFKPVLITIKI